MLVLKPLSGAMTVNEQVLPMVGKLKNLLMATEAHELLKG
jgi:hypothetical protein